MTTDILTFTKAVADETRQEMMAHMCCVWCSVTDLVEKLGGKVNQPTVSHHLKKLEEAGLVLVRQDGRHRYYTLNQARMTFCCGQLVQQFAPDYADQVVSLDAIRVNEG